jgi:ABC-type phosphonate transport system ATPase subunit
LFGAGLLPNVDRVALDGVTYLYDPREGRGVRDVTFVLERGRSLAIVGETGELRAPPLRTTRQSPSRRGTAWRS